MELYRDCGQRSRRGNLPPTLCPTRPWRRSSIRPASRRAQETARAGGVLVFREGAMNRRLADLSAFAGRRYAAQAANGENPWNTIDPPRVDAAKIERTAVPARLTESIATAPVVLVLCVDLKVVASIDQDLERVGIISGASIYPFAWNILLAARREGFGGTITTLATAREPDIKASLGIPPHIAVCAVMPLGRPVHRLSRLKRKPVAEFARRERWDGPSFG